MADAPVTSFPFVAAAALANANTFHLIQGSGAGSDKQLRVDELDIYSKQLSNRKLSIVRTANDLTNNKTIHIEGPADGDTAPGGRIGLNVKQTTDGEEAFFGYDGNSNTWTGMGIHSFNSSTLSLGSYTTDYNSDAGTGAEGSIRATGSASYSDVSLFARRLAANKLARIEAYAQDSHSAAHLIANQINITAEDPTDFIFFTSPLSRFYGNVRIDNGSLAITPINLGVISGTIATDANLSNNFRGILNGNITLANPTNLRNGQVINYYLQQDGVGSRTVTLGSIFSTPTPVVASTAANATDFMSCYYDQTANKLFCIYTNQTSSGGTSVTVSDDVAQNATHYPTFSAATSGTVSALEVSSTKLTYNPSTGTLSAVTLNATSDMYLKTNVNTIENAIGVINSIRGVTFNWLENNKKSSGVVAQEIEYVLPFLVQETEGAKSVNYNGLIGYLIQAVKELSRANTDLTVRIVELENRA